MKKIFISILAVGGLLWSHAQQKNFDVSGITEGMKKNAYSVIRDERLEFEVKAIDKAVYKVHKVVTVLEEEGKSELIFHEFEDRFRSLTAASIQLFDSHGFPLQQYRRSDLLKQTAGEGLIPDGKVFYLEVPPQSYPVTIMMDYEIKFTGLLNYPDYEVQLPEQSIESSSFRAIIPVDLDLLFKGKNTDITPVKTDDGKIKTYTWSVQNLPALEYETGSVSYESKYPRVLLSPNKFQLDGYAGDMSTWENFGKWYGSLAKNTDNLKPERKLFFQSLVKDATNDREKVGIIYNYLQSNCRYVLIALGIGGFKPFEADFVDKKKYGDCKALSNYTQACLNAVGIKSYQALINASYNKEPVDPLFPHNSFNHVILCVPLQKDSIWLECTSTSTECGELGNFTENRNALLITENGGKLVATPKSTASENIFSSYSTIELAADGSGNVQVALNTSGEYKQDLLHYVSNQKKDDQKTYLVNYIGYMQPDDFSIDYDQVDKKAATKMTMTMSGIPEFTAGRKVFLNPRLYKIWANSLPRAENRRLDFYFEHPFIKTDTTIYKLPEGFTIETLPKSRKLEFEYGSFNSSCKYDEATRTVISVARLELNEYKIPAEKFLATRKFFNEVGGEYTEKIVVKKP